MSPDEIIQLWNESKNKKDFKVKLRERGFKTIGCGEQSLVLSKKNIDFVVKVTDKGGVPTKKFKDPILEKYRLGYIFTSEKREVAIQKKANRSKKSKYRAWATIRDAVNPETDLYRHDIHQDNVGFINRKPVIFDYK